MDDRAQGDASIDQIDLLKIQRIRFIIGNISEHGQRINFSVYLHTGLCIFVGGICDFTEFLVFSGILIKKVVFQAGIIVRSFRPGGIQYSFFSKHEGVGGIDHAQFFTVLIGNTNGFIAKIIEHGKVLGRLSICVFGIFCAGDRCVFRTAF